MASQVTCTLFSLQFILFSCFFTITSGAFCEEEAEAIAIKRVEKTTHLHFYFHDIVSGENPSAIRIAGPDKSSFGDTMMADDLLTEGPEISSKPVGKAQGLYALAAQNDISLLMVMNYAFTEGEYNGSSISILGRNQILNDVREMPIVGGSGLFRLAHGYALAHTVWFDEQGFIFSTYGSLVKVIRSIYCTLVLVSDATRSASYHHLPLKLPSRSLAISHNSYTSSSLDQKTAPKMATFIPFILYSVVFSTFFSVINSKFSEQSPITMKDMEKKTSLHFYFHDIPGGKNQTSTAIARPINMTAASKSFGITFMADDMLREGPEPTSKLVGRAQGIYGFASQQNAVLLMVMNFAFVDGIYNGSSLSILGRNAVFDNVREMPVVGGSGVFRLARGYALAKTFSFNLKTGVAVVEYNVSVVHF